MSSMTGNRIKLSIFGESHGAGIGCVIDGLPSGKALDFEAINREMRRRAPGRDKSATPRKEADVPQILSGIKGGVTTGAPLAMLIENQNTNSEDYADLQYIPRPSHSDYPAYVKYGEAHDMRGGGHFSGRLTAPLVFAGAVAKQFLADKGIYIGAHIKRIGAVQDMPFAFNEVTPALLARLQQENFSVIDSDKEALMRAEIEQYRQQQDSIGGEIECAAIGLPAGIGGNMTDTLESRLSALLFAIPAVKGVQFGLGFGFAEACASQVNDAYETDGSQVRLQSNYNGGILGGISTGAPLVFSVAIKPTPSIARPQASVNLQTMENETLCIHGRHDPCIVPRAVSAVEAATAFVLLDCMV